MNRNDLVVHRFEYDPATLELTVTQSNGVVVYDNVKQGEFNDFKSAMDKGEHLAIHIAPYHRQHKA